MLMDIIGELEGKSNLERQKVIEQSLYDSDIDFKAIQYSSNEQLKKELTKLGVKYDCYKK